MHFLPPTPGFAFLDHTVIGCSLVRGTPYRYIGKTLEQKPECNDWPLRWSTQVGQDQPDVALLIIGRWETVDRVNEGKWTHIGDPSFDAYLNAELERALNIVGSTGVRVVVATVPYSRGGEQPNGRLYPEDQPDRANQWNTMLRNTVGLHPGEHPRVQLVGDGGEHEADVVDRPDVRRVLDQRALGLHREGQVGVLVVAAEARPEDQVDIGRDRRRRVDLEQGELVDDLGHRAAGPRRRGVEQLRPDRDPARLLDVEDAHSLASAACSGSSPIEPRSRAAVWKALRSKALPCRACASARASSQIRSPTLYDGAWPGQPR